MNRAIKFRCWLPERKKLFLVFEMAWNSSEDVTFIDGETLNGEACSIWNDNSGMPEHILSQFTGLKDRNNKEIYEGDIVKIDPNSIAYLLKLDVPKYTAGVITWLREGFEVCQQGRDFGAVNLSEFASCNCCPCGLEIIGNVFENPELLN